MSHKWNIKLIIRYILDDLLPWWKDKKASHKEELHTCTSVSWCTEFHADLNLQGSAAEGVALLWCILPIW